MRNIKLVMIPLILFASLHKSEAQWCADPNPEFCPGNFFTNGNFESIQGDPSQQRDQDIGIAQGWQGRLWESGSWADLFCHTGSHVGTRPAGTGVFSGMWIENTSASNDAVYREGMYNELLTPILYGTGFYSFNLDIANSGIGSSQIVEIGIYGVFNPNHTVAQNPINSNNPLNENLWLSQDPTVRVVLLGTISVNPNDAAFTTGSWSSQSISFNSSNTTFPTTGITHIMITKNTGFMPNYAKQYLYFDNFCMQRFGPNTNCCETPIDPWNASGTPNPLNYTQQIVNGQAVSVASETFEIHRNSSIPITELRVSVMDIHFEYNHEGCAQCISNPALWGSLSTSTTTIGNRTTGLSQQGQYYSSGGIPTMIHQRENIRELIWENHNGTMLVNGNNFQVQYILPPQSEIPCCATSVRICTKISWKDANCRVCEVNTCSNISLASHLQKQSNLNGSGNKRSGSQQWNIEYCCANKIENECIEWKICGDPEIGKSFRNRIIADNQISGRLIYSDPNNAEVPKISKLNLIGPENNVQIAFTKTDDFGNFSFQNIPTGVYKISMDMEPAQYQLEIQSKNHHGTEKFKLALLSEVVVVNPMDSIPGIADPYNYDISGFRRCNNGFEQWLGSSWSNGESSFGWHDVMRDDKPVTCARFIISGGSENLDLELLGATLYPHKHIFFINDDGSCGTSFCNDKIAIHADRAVYFDRKSNNDIEVMKQLKAGICQKCGGLIGCNIVCNCGKTMECDDDKPK